MQYVPHLRLCRVRDRAADGSWQLVEHEIDFGWYAPRVKYVSAPTSSTDQSITFQQVSGDFKANEASGNSSPPRTARARCCVTAPTSTRRVMCPNWLARSTFKREMPQMLTDLRRRCEAEQACARPAATT